MEPWDSDGTVPPRDDVRARRLWLPWGPRFRLIFAYPRGWHWILVRLGRFDLWVTPRFLTRDRPLPVRVLGWVVLFPLFVAVRFLGLVAVLEVTIIAFAASIYLLWGEWVVLLLLVPVVLAARLVHALPWRLVARAGDRRWTTRVTGWEASRQAATSAEREMTAGGEPATPPWSRTRRAARIWK